MADNPITTPLPADLPTDWVYGQTIGPQGTDVGLTQQHGYNYLMQQVNAAQQAATQIGQAFSGLPTLGSDGKIPASQLPAMNYDPRLDGAGERIGRRHGGLVGLLVRLPANDDARLILHQVFHKREGCRDFQIIRNEGPSIQKRYSAGKFHVVMRPICVCVKFDDVHVTAPFIPVQSSRMSLHSSSDIWNYIR